MILVRPGTQRGYADHGWLQSWHSFSFADYFDPRFMGWGCLRVINEDRIAPGTGFGMHGHRDMEIITVVLAGELTHEDSMGHRATIGPGEVQHMGAGRGVMHSEFNHGSTPVHLLQIWIQPRARGLPPRYAQKRFELARRQGQWCPLALPPERIAASDPGAALPIEADAALYAGCFDGDQRATYPLDPARLAYVHVVRGRVRINGQPFTAGDAAMIRQEAAVELSAGEQAEVLLFDLAPSSAFPAG